VPALTTPICHQLVVTALHLGDLDLLDLVAEQPLVTERIAHLVRALAVELVGRRHLHRGAARDGMCTEGIAVVDVQVDQGADHLARGRREQVELRILIAQHQRDRAELQFGMADAASPTHARAPSRRRAGSSTPSR
jgi:hypothetical protein